MIRAVFGRDRVTVMGHAGYAPKGQDIVCAAASALVFALIGSLRQEENLREVVIRPGYVTAAAKGPCRAGAGAGAVRTGAAGGAVSPMRRGGGELQIGS